MAWSFKESPSSTTYTTMFEWHKTADKVGVKGFHFADFVRMDYQLYVPAILNNTNNNILINPGINTSVVDASRVDVSNRLRTDEIGTLGYSTNRVVHLKSQNFDGATGFVMARNGTGGMLWLGTARAMLRANSGGGQPGYIELTENTVTSLTIYNRTYTSTTQQVRVTQNGVLGHSTSSRRYKLYEKTIDLDYAKKIFGIDAVSWYDKRQAEERAAYLTKLNNGEECNIKEDCEEPITRIGGVIAEDMHDAGLEMFVEYDDENRPNGISSNTWALFIPILKEYQEVLEEHKKEINQLKELVKNEKRK